MTTSDRWRATSARSSGVSLPAQILIALVIVGAIAAAVHFAASRMVAAKQRVHCLENLQSLAGIYAELNVRHPGPDDSRSGTALILGWRGGAGPISPGQEGLFGCVGDPQFRRLQTDEDHARYDSIDLAAPPRDACSYAVRDFGRFPVPNPPTGNEVFAACTSHPDGAMLALVDGRVRVCTWAELGLTGPEEADVGPGAKSPLLRQVCRTPGVTEK